MAQLFLFAQEAHFLNTMMQNISRAKNGHLFCAGLGPRSRMDKSSLTIFESQYLRWWLSWSSASCTVMWTWVRPQAPRGKTKPVVNICNLGDRQAEAGGFLRLVVQLYSQSSELGLSETFYLGKKKGRERLKTTDSVDPGPPCVSMYTYRHIKSMSTHSN